MFNFFKKKFIDETLEEQLKDLAAAGFIIDLAITARDCDVLPNATGEFGRSLTNPIPVNGPIGEIKYLNRLRTADGGLILHRLGSNGTIDIYEVVSMGGKIWDVLYLDMYHPRRSRNLPTGYTFSEFDEIFCRSGIGYCTNGFDPDFPFGMANLIEQRIGGTLGARFARKYEETIADRSKFVRPQSQIDKIKSK